MQWVILLPVGKAKHPDAGRLALPAGFLDFRCFATNTAETPKARKAGALAPA